MIPKDQSATEITGEQWELRGQIEHPLPKGLPREPRGGEGREREEKSVPTKPTARHTPRLRFTGARGAVLSATSHPPILRPCSRAEFLTRLAAGLVAVLAAGVNGADDHPAPTPRSAGRGRPGSKVKRWDVITIGNLSRNRYWGESDAKGVRSAICTCTVIQGEGFRLIVDPSLTSSQEMAKELDRRTGLKPRDLTTVFITHEHGDHWFGLLHFPEARWLAAPEVAAALNKTGKLPKPVEPITGRLFEAIDIVPTPGHTWSHHSLRFDCDGRSIVIAGDAVPTLDFWRERRGYFNCVDFELSAKTMDKIAALADVVVPGHDNYFLNPP